MLNFADAFDTFPDRFTLLKTHPLKSYTTALQIL